MTIYVFFPVAVFYYFNMPDFFEKFVAEKRVTRPQLATMGSEVTHVPFYSFRRGFIPKDM